MVLLPCDSRMPKPPPAVANLVEYSAPAGGCSHRLVGHLAAEAPTVGGLVSWLPQANHLGDDYSASVDQSFPKGKAFAEWLQVVGATGATGQLPIQDIFEGGALARAARPAQRWLYTDGRQRRASSTSPSTRRWGPRPPSNAAGSSTATST